MALSGTSALIFALGVWMAPPAADFSAIGITTGTKAPVVAAPRHQVPRCPRGKRAPCPALLPEQESSELV